MERRIAAEALGTAVSSEAVDLEVTRHERKVVP